MSEPILLVVSLAALALAIVGIQLAARRVRLTLVDAGEIVLADAAVSTDVKDWINDLLDTCMSFRVGLLLPFAILSVMADDVLGINQPDDSSDGDERLHRLAGLYSLSVLAANPLAALINVPLLIVGLCVHLAFSRESPFEAAEESVEKAVGKAARSVASTYGKLAQAS